MSGAPFDESGLQGLTDVAKNIVVAMADFLKAILAHTTQLIVEISMPQALVPIPTGSILYFSHLNKRLGRDFVILHSPHDSELDLQVKVEIGYLRRATAPPRPST